jgi:predicted protein tyrosine phosphatase
MLTKSIYQFKKHQLTLIILLRHCIAGSASSSTSAAGVAWLTLAMHTDGTAVDLQGARVHKLLVETEETHDV